MQASFCLSVYGLGFYFMHYTKQAVNETSPQNLCFNKYKRLQDSLFDFAAKFSSDSPEQKLKKAVATCLLKNLPISAMDRKTFSRIFQKAHVARTGIGMAICSVCRAEAQRR
ncbi:UNVERIFIED_CONTAM: hypothetical protein K2H54_033871 [Gekko kuhli]